MKANNVLIIHYVVYDVKEVNLYPNLVDWSIYGLMQERCISFESSGYEYVKQNIKPEWESKCDNCEYVVCSRCKRKRSLYGEIWKM